MIESESGVWRWGRQRDGNVVGSEGRRSTPDEDVGTQIGAIAPDDGPALGVDFPESLWVLEQFFEDPSAHERTDIPVDHGIVREVETQTKPLQGLDCANPDESHKSGSYLITTPKNRLISGMLPLPAVREMLLDHTAL
jgi:hypothetical protein